MKIPKANFIKVNVKILNRVLGKFYFKLINLLVNLNNQ